ncbi:MAG: 50S ribosomal protein L6 [Patescibacteria group bacterium]
MSRIGRQTISILDGVTIEPKGAEVLVSGPKGSLSLSLPRFIQVKLEDGQALVTRQQNDKKTKSNHGTVQRLLGNMIHGVSQGWEKKLEVIGTGYGASLAGDKLVLKLGFSHNIEFVAPTGIVITVTDNVITVSGVDKELVGNTAAKIRKFKKPDAYQGKGVRYQGEEVKLKPGKAAKGAE